MLARKNSSGRPGVSPFGGRESIAVISDFLSTQQKKITQPSTDPNNVTIADLAIPDTMCSLKGGGGYECPGGAGCTENSLKKHIIVFALKEISMSIITTVLQVCMRLNLNAKAEGFYGMFNDFGASVFTVYLAASEEGWVYVLYDCMDSLPSHLAFIYFLTLIFFLAWLVKNVFIAVITETFAEIRVQFSEMWQKKDVTLDEEFRQKLEKNEDGWRLIRLDADINLIGPKYKLQRVKMSSSNFSIKVGFTVLFNLECLIKISCYGFRNFLRRGIFKFEMILCIGSSLNAIKYFYDRNYFTYFQAFRLLRLIKASPILEDFVWKIFSPGKKLGGLVIFTITFVIIASAISLQLFYAVPDLDHFHTFPQAFMSMFQIITQEGWTDFVVEVLRATDDKLVPFVAVYFVAYHLFVTLIVLSLFVAVILDNLEMDEELKKVKQLRAREATTSMRSTLPWRLRVFEKFPTRPQMAAMRRVDSEFPMPKVRDSFAHQFALEGVDSETYDQGEERSKIVLRHATSKRFCQDEPHFRHIGSISLRTSIANLLDKSRTMTGKFLQTAMRTKQLLYNENGDLSRPSDSAPKKDLKQGEIDIRALQQKRHLAEITRTRIEEDMRENHPFFDRPLFLVGRASRLREFCKKVVHSRYYSEDDGSNGGSKTKRRFKEIRTLVGIMPYLDWGMVTITVISCISMLFESPWPTSGENLVMNNLYLQIGDYVFVLTMTFELLVKIVGNGLFFTPKAVVSDVGGVMTMFIYFTSLSFLVWMPRHVEINSFAQLLMIFRAMRPLRIYTLVPHIRRVVLEFFRGFKEILLVTILMVVVMFIFASFGVQIVGGKLAACNDPSIISRENCTGIFWQKIFVTRLEVYGKDDEELHPKILVPRVWTNPRNFNFDHVGNAMLALFETLSYKGWNVIRDILWSRQGPWAVVFIHIYVFIGCMIGLTLFVGVVIANYTENRVRRDFRINPYGKKNREGSKELNLFEGTALLTVDQRRWHDLKARLKMAQPLHVPPKPSESARLRTLFYELTLSRRFSQIFAFLVLLNSACLVVPWNVEEEGERSTVLLSVTILSALINILFAVEIVPECTLDIVSPVDIARSVLTFPSSDGDDPNVSPLPEQTLVRHVNFRTGSEALVVLFRSITGEDWNDIMHDCMVGCVLSLSIIMENFSLFYSSEEDALLSYADIRNFQVVWNMVDREQKRSIPVGRVKFLLRLLKGRLEVDPEKDRILFKHMCYEMDKLHNGDDVSFHDVLYMLSYRSVDIRKSLQLEELLQREELEFIIEEEVAKQTIRTWLENCLRRIRNPQKQKDSFVDVSKYPHPISTGIILTTQLFPCDFDRM
ncbi:transporter, cation channel family protein [Necator americanus]|uniref:Transporter, cation channel family protein n=1 Tax=Necator americanus TaxID=51031 RepID=W2TMC0_NECAM|nr:transporter, cation channel family protein [Necator americanus]ETN82182.1 transporter, cation channel family protein [Necator americanus]